MTAPLAGRVAGAFDGWFESWSQGKDAALAVFGEGVQIEGVIVEGRKIDFEVAGVDDDAHRGVNGQSYAIDQRVSDANGLNGEGPRVNFPWA